MIPAYRGFLLTKSADTFSGKSIQPIQPIFAAPDGNSPAVKGPSSLQTSILNPGDPTSDAVAASQQQQQLTEAQEAAQKAQGEIEAAKSEAQQAQAQAQQAVQTANMTAAKAQHEAELARHQLKMVEHTIHSEADHKVKQVELERKRLEEELKLHKSTAATKPDAALPGVISAHLGQIEARAKRVSRQAMKLAAAYTRTLEIRDYLNAREAAGLGTQLDLALIKAAGIKVYHDAPHRVFYVTGDDPAGALQKQASAPEPTPAPEPAPTQSAPPAAPVPPTPSVDTSKSFLDAGKNLRLATMPNLRPRNSFAPPTQFSPGAALAGAKSIIKEQAETPDNMYRTVLTGGPYKPLDQNFSAHQDALDAKNIHGIGPRAVAWGKDQLSNWAYVPRSLAHDAKYNVADLTGRGLDYFDKARKQTYQGLVEGGRGARTIWRDVNAGGPGISGKLHGLWNMPASHLDAFGQAIGRPIQSAANVLTFGLSNKGLEAINPDLTNFNAPPKDPMGDAERLRDQNPNLWGPPADAATAGQDAGSRVPSNTSDAQTLQTTGYFHQDKFPLPYASEGRYKSPVAQWGSMLLPMGINMVAPGLGRQILPAYDPTTEGNQGGTLLDQLQQAQYSPYLAGYGVNAMPYLPGMAGYNPQPTMYPGAPGQ